MSTTFLKKFYKHNLEVHPPKLGIEPLGWWCEVWALSLLQSLKDVILAGCWNIGFIVLGRSPTPGYGMKNECGLTQNVFFGNFTQKTAVIAEWRVIAQRKKMILGDRFMLMLYQRSVGNITGINTFASIIVFKGGTARSRLIIGDFSHIRWFHPNRIRDPQAEPCTTAYQPVSRT